MLITSRFSFVRWRPWSYSHSSSPWCHPSPWGRHWFRVGWSSCSPFAPWVPGPQSAFAGDVSVPCSLPPPRFVLFGIILVILDIPFGLYFNPPTSVFSKLHPHPSKVWTRDVEARSLSVPTSLGGWDCLVRGTVRKVLREEAADSFQNERPFALLLGTGAGMGCWEGLWEGNTR